MENKDSAASTSSQEEEEEIGEERGNHSDEIAEEERENYDSNNSADEMEMTTGGSKGPSPEELAEARTPRARNAVYTWYTRLDDLYRYKAKYGHCNVPQKYPPNKELGIWVNKQRQEKNILDKNDPNEKSSLTQQKIKALEDIGFQWAKRKGEHSWNEKYIELKQYRDKYGHCHVPTKYKKNPALGRWVSTQRSQYKQYIQGDKASGITSGRIKKLEKLDFKWTKINTNKIDGNESDDRRSNSGDSYNSPVRRRQPMLPTSKRRDAIRALLTLANVASSAAATATTPTSTDATTSTTSNSTHPHGFVTQT